MGRGGGRQKKGVKNNRFSNRRPVQTEKLSFGEENIDDEIDTFHKQRDVIPLGRNDLSDEDEEHPVLDFQGLREDSDETDSGDSVDDMMAKHDGDHDKMVKQQRILQRKYGGVEEDFSEDSDKEGKPKASFTRGKQFLYGADNVDFEIQSDEEDLAEEEAIALMSQKEKAKSLSMEDFGLENVEAEENDEYEERKSFQDAFGGDAKKAQNFGSLYAEAFELHEEIKKDISTLTKEEQMNIVYSSAPELVGLLSELNEAIDQLHGLKSVLHKVRRTKGLNYFETKQKLLLAYIQAITFYLLLKAEGHPVRDHPVIAQLVELKNLCDKVKNMDTSILPLVETISTHDNEKVSAVQREEEKLSPELDTEAVTAPAKATGVRKLTESDLPRVKSSSGPKQDDQVRSQMLKVRALLEEKLKQKGIFDSVTQNPTKTKNDVLRSGSRQTEALAVFEDDVTDSGKNTKCSLVPPAKVKKQKLASGDDDLPKRESIGEKRKKFDLRAVAIDGEAGGDTDDDDGPNKDAEAGSRDLESEDEFYKEVKKQRLTKLSAKAALYTRDSSGPRAAEAEADGKRHITYQMEKNKGLTRHRKKLTKIPRKKYKLKHAKAVVRRKGQVRDIRKPSGPYGGETSGINTRVSRSIRFKG
ncbi:sas10/U3 ribonucleoprotein (Utp) family protein [Wolffia australiana]